MNEIKLILMKRDGISEKEATSLIYEAKEALYACIAEGDLEGAEEVMSDYLGLESDYLMELV